MSNRRRAAKARLAKRGRPYKRAPEAKLRRERLSTAQVTSHLPQCTRCFKVSYPSKAEAEAAMRVVGGRKAYPCHDDPTLWHLTSQS